MTKRPAFLAGAVVAIGNFDGVHRGHRAVLDAAVKESRRLGAPVCAVTFEPHPYALFAGEKEPFLLTPSEEKERLLRLAGAQRVVALPFTAAFAEQTAAAFIDAALIGERAVAHVVIGFDFVFGRARGGDAAALRQGLLPHGVGVTIVPPERDAKGLVISSSRIRAAVKRGAMEEAADLLGRPFSIEGVVQKGERRGRALSFPTANIETRGRVAPAHGVYAVRATRRDGDGLSLRGVANFGVRPTFGGRKERLETHLFDFSGDLYGQVWRVDLVRFLRPEKAFASSEDLVRHIAADCRAAREALDG